MLFVLGTTNLLVFTLACATGFNRGEMETSLRAGNPTYVTSQLTVEEIEKLQPQVQLPIRLAVAPPQTAYRGRWGATSLGTWIPEEVEEIESWEKPLRDAGVIKDLLILPSLLIDDCRWDDPGCSLRANRAAAARVHADALLVMNVATAVDSYANPASALNLTIVGMWLVPGHHRDALTIVEGVMIDNRNEYLYAFARGEGEEKTIRPLMYADEGNAIWPSRLEALQRFGKAFLEEASSLRTR